MADGFLAGNAGDFLSGTIKGGDAPVVIHREHTIGDALQDDIGDIGAGL